MSIEKPDHEKADRAFSLSEHDKKIVENGLAVLRDGYFVGKTPEEMPDLLIFPETSSRPLVYALKPLLEAEYGKRGMVVPDISFMIPNAKDDLQWPGLPLRNSEGAIYMEGRDPADEDLGYMYDDEEIEAMKGIEKGRALNLSRMKQILKYHPGCRKVLLVDDAALDSDATLTEVKACLKIVQPEVEVDAFVFLSDLPSNEKRLVGEVREDLHDDWLVSFHYNHNDQKESLTGVHKKEREYAELVMKSSQADLKSMRAIREQMSMLGEQAMN